MSVTVTIPTREVKQNTYENFMQAKEGRVKCMVAAVGLYLAHYADSELKLLYSQHDCIEHHQRIHNDVATTDHNDIGWTVQKLLDTLSIVEHASLFVDVEGYVSELIRRYAKPTGVNMLTYTHINAHSFSITLTHFKE